MFECSAALTRKSSSPRSDIRCGYTLSRILHDEAGHRRFPPNPLLRGQIEEVRLLDSSGQEDGHFFAGSTPLAEITLLIREPLRNCHLACIVTSADGSHIFSTADTDLSPELFATCEPGRYIARVELPMSKMNMGVTSLQSGSAFLGSNSSTDKRHYLS